MRAENIIGLVIYLLVAMIMVGIGVSQFRSKKPVGFYSGEQPPKEDELSDGKGWNQRHGIMWIIYGAVIMIYNGIGMMMGDSIWCVIPMGGGVVIPLPVMIWYHHRLIGRYKI